MKSIGQCFQLGPRDLCVHAHAQAAVRTRNHPFPTDEVRESSDSIRDDLGMLDDVRRVAHDTRNQDLALW
jgi:hypothetical protein